MKNDIQIHHLTQDKFEEAVDLVLRAELDSREEIEHHLCHLDAHSVAVKDIKIIGVIGWYQDNVNYANKAMGDKFPGVDAYWVGFFAVDEKFQGQGVGNSLLDHLIDEVRKKGADKLWVSSVPDTWKYYMKHGFNLVMKGKISGNSKYFMVRDLKNKIRCRV